MKESRFFYVPDAASVDRLSDEEAQHAARVLRLKPGDEIFLDDGKGSFFRAHLTMVGNHRCHYAIDEAMPQERAWRGHIHMAMAPTKMMERTEWMAEKATEVGFDELTMLSCRFSERRTVRTDRLERIVVGAVKQSRKPWKPVVNGMTPFADFIHQPRGGEKYICHCYEEVAKADLMELLLQPADNCDVTILIGPEGDFSIDEVNEAIDCGYKSVSLGRSRLRTETAALQAVVMAQLARRIV